MTWFSRSKEHDEAPQETTPAALDNQRRLVEIDLKSTNVDQLDDDHLKLVGYCEEIHALVESMPGGVADRSTLTRINDVFGKLLDYTNTHFTREERYIERNNLPNYRLQRMRHEEFLAMVSNYKRVFNMGHVAESANVKDFLKSWLVNHINTIDYHTFRNETYIPPGEPPIVEQELELEQDQDQDQDQVGE
ncbi:hemerythrin domain-containing protein [Magnetofaba australis]|uniref:Putative hemerythrin-like metal-binding protein n=1 Tax=Magnetofaba australis IT-1 TaxID=1434232 RepID=A0A1Y2JZK6_9PROT|nr:hemerythrin domain-containing protein [Magnetofaba australis]OSM00309.1 putative hemerythrin-like metal-binding protein [Magnetofaba australis IT-1]